MPFYINRKGQGHYLIDPDKDVIDGISLASSSNYDNKEDHFLNIENKSIICGNEELHILVKIQDAPSTISHTGEHCGIPLGDIDNIESLFKCKNIMTALKSSYTIVKNWAEAYKVKGNPTVKANPTWVSFFYYYSYYVELFDTFIFSKMTDEDKLLYELTEMNII